MKQKVKKLIPIVIVVAIALIVSICALADYLSAATTEQEIISVEQGTVVTVPYGTTLEEVTTEKLPQNVTAEVLMNDITEVDMLSYNFDDNTQPSDWTLLSDAITFSDGKMVFASNTNIKAHVGKEAMTDYVVQADLQLTDTQSNNAGIMFRATNATNAGADSYNGYYAGISAGKITIGYADGKWHDVKSVTTYSVDETKAYTLKVMVYGEGYYVLIKEAEQAESEFTLVYSGTQSLYANGYVGLRSYKRAFTADNFVVRAINSQDLESCNIANTEQATVPVTNWACTSTYDGETPGKYEFVGTIDDAYNNPNSLTAKAVVTVQSAPEEEDSVHTVSSSQVTVEDEYWSDIQKQFICKVIPVAIERISTETGGMQNFKKASEYLATKTGNYTTEDAPAHSGAIYVDSDDYKVIEAMCFALQLDAKGDEEILAAQANILKQLEEWIPWIVGSQEADGYLYTSYTLDYTNSSNKNIGIMRFNGRTDDMPVHTDGSLYTIDKETYDIQAHFQSAHELYCAGHFYEAAVAHYNATGDFRLLDVAVKNADLVVRTFGTEEGQVYAVPGHEEIELALVKLANLCEEIGVANDVDYGSKAESYLATAKFFLDAKGQSEDLYDGVVSNWDYYQNDIPVAEQRTAHGHVVRAHYLYSAMADIGLLEITEGRENPYDEALQAIWEDSLTKTYITGGIGIPEKEAYPESYELPNDGAYCETCAQISNAMWNQRMNLLYGDSKYADSIEWNLYNSIISCVNFNGDAFFYQNHLTCDSDFERSSWFGTACCPPNLMRTVFSIGGYIYAQETDGDIRVNQYIGNTADLNVAGELVNISMTSDFPWYGTATLTVNETSENAFAISFRIPEWATGANTITLNGETVSAEPNENGYVVIERVWAVGDKVELSFPMEAERIYSDEKVIENNGLVAVRRGPVIYCAESEDNENVDVRSDAAVLPTDATFTVSELQQLPGRTNEDYYGVEDVITISYEGTYEDIFGETQEISMTLIPYYAWNNRGSSDMTVYLIEDTNTHPLEYYATPSASYSYEYAGDSPKHLNNGTSLLIDNTAANNDRWSSYNSIETENWVEYAFDGEVVLRGSWISWFDDGGGCQVPTGLTIKYWDGAEWKDVTNLTGTDSFSKNNYTTVEGEGYYGFDEITTTKIRLYPTNENTTQKVAQPAIIEWRLDGEIADGTTYLPKEYEAEQGIIAGKTITKYSTAYGYPSANGYVGQLDNAASSVTMTVYAPVEGTYDMAIRYGGYAASYPNASHKYYVNDDVDNAQIVMYEQVNTWTDWYTQTVQIVLEEGYNTITFTHSGLTNSYAQLDGIVLTKVNAAREVIDLIKAIGVVTSESKADITAAREAYDMLPDAEKEKVTNYSTLTAAEKTYQSILDGAYDPSTKIDDCEKIFKEFSVKKAASYLAGDNTHPELEGYLFAGWYTTNVLPTDAEEAVQYVIEDSVPEGVETVYALFVPEHVLSIKAQISAHLIDNNVTTDDETAAIRFVTTVDSLLYKQVGFEVSYKDADGNVKTAVSVSNKVYKSLYVADSNTDVWQVTPQGTFCGVSQYFKACTVTGVPVSNYPTEFTVKPFWVTLDGDKVYGVEATKAIEDGCLRDNVYVSDDGQDIAYHGTYDNPYKTLDYAIAHVNDGEKVHVKDNVTVASTTEDTNVAQWTAHGKTVTITGNDKVEGTETLDFSATSTVLIKDNVTFSDITLKLMDDSIGTKQTIFAEGNDLTIHSDVVFSNASAVMNNEFNLVLVGGSSTKSVESTNLKLYGGTYTAIYVGGTTQSVLGDTNITVGEKVNADIDYTKHNYYHMLYGGCYSGTVYGNTNIIVEDGAKFNYIFGGGEAEASKIIGTTNIQFEGQSMAIYGGSRYGTNADTHVVMTGGEVYQIFGGCEGNSMEGNTDVQVLGGKVYRRIYGGCYNNYSLSSGWSDTLYQVTGYTSVTIGAGAEASLDTDTDTGLLAVSRYKSTFDKEWGVLIFNDDMYSNTTYNLSAEIGSSFFTSNQAYHYLVTANAGGDVYSAGDCIYIKPDSGNVATVTIDGVVKHYTEGDSYYQLPALSSSTSQEEIVVTFGTTEATDFIESAEAKIATGEGYAYYETLEQAIAAAEKMENVAIENLSETKGLATISVAEGENGTVKSNCKNCIAGETVTLTVTPDAGYNLKKLSVKKDGTEVTLNETVTLAGGTYSFVTEEGNYTVEAEFAKPLFTGWKTDDCWDFTKQYENIIALNSTCEKTTHATYVGVGNDYTDVDFTVKVKDGTNESVTSKTMFILKFNDNNNTKYGRVDLSIQSSGDDVCIYLNCATTGGTDSVVYTLTEAEAQKYKSDGIEMRMVRKGLKLAVYLDGNQCELTNDTYSICQNGVVTLTASTYITETMTTSLVLQHLHDAGAQVEFPYKLNTSVEQVTINVTDSENGTVVPESGLYVVGDTISLKGQGNSGYYCYGYNVDGKFVEADKNGTYSFVATDDIYEVEALFAKQFFTGWETDSCWDFTKQYKNIIELNSTCEKTTHATYVGAGNAYTDVDFTVKVKDGTNESVTTKTMFILKFNDNNNTKNGRVDLSIQSSGDDVCIYLNCATTGGTDSVVYTLTEAEAQKYKSDGIEMRMVRKGLKIAVYLDGNQCELTNDTYSICENGVVTLTASTYITETMTTSLVLQHSHDAGAQVEFPYKLNTSVEQVTINVTDSENGTVVPESGFYVVGDTISLIGQGDSGYYCYGYNVDGEFVEADKNGTYSFEATKDAYEVEALFAKQFFTGWKTDSCWDFTKQYKNIIALNSTCEKTSHVTYVGTGKAYTDVDFTVKVKDGTNESVTTKTMFILKFNDNNSETQGWVGFSIQSSGDNVFIYLKCADTGGTDSVVYTLTEAEAQKYKSDGIEMRMVRKGLTLAVYLDGNQCELTNDTYSICENGVVTLTASEYITETMTTSLVLQHLHDAGAQVEFPYKLNTSVEQVTINVTDSENGTVVPESGFYVVGDTISLKGQGNSGYYCYGYNVNGEFVEADKNGTYSFVATEDIYEVEALFEKQFFTGWKTDSCWDFTKQYKNIIELNSTCEKTTHATYVGVGNAYTDVDFAVKVKDGTNVSVTSKTMFILKFNDNNSTKNGRVDLSIQSSGDDVYVYLNCADTGGTDSVVYTLTEAEAQKYKSDGIEMRVVRKGLKLAVYLDGNQCELTNDTYSICQNSVVTLTASTYITETMTTSLVLQHLHDAGTQVEFPYKLNTSVEQVTINVTDSENGTLVPKSGFYVVGDTVVLGSEAADGYYCSEMKVDGATVEMNWDGTYSFVAEKESYTVEGIFEERVFKDSANEYTLWNTLKQNQGSVKMTDGRTGTKGVASAFTDAATASGKYTALEFYDSYTDMDLTLTVKNDPNTSSGETPRTAVEFAFANDQKLKVSVTEIGGDVYIQTMDGLISWKRIYKFSDEQADKYRTAEGVEWRIVRKGTQFFFSIDGVVCEQDGEASADTWYIADIVDLTAITDSTVEATTEATVKLLHYGDAGQWIEMPFTVTGTVNTLSVQWKTDSCWNYTKQYIDVLSLNGSSCTKTTHATYIGASKAYTDVDFTVKVKDGTNESVTSKTMFILKFNDNNNTKNGRVDLSIQSSGDDVCIYLNCATTGGTDSVVYTLTEAEAQKYKSGGIEMRVVRKGLKLAVYLDGNQCELTNDTYSICENGVVTLTASTYITETMTTSLVLQHLHDEGAQVEFLYKLYTTVDEDVFNTTN